MRPRAQFGSAPKLNATLAVMMSGSSPSPNVIAIWQRGSAKVAGRRYGVAEARQKKLRSQSPPRTPGVRAVALASVAMLQQRLELCAMPANVRPLPVSRNHGPPESP